MIEEVLLTKEGLEGIKKEYDVLTSVKRIEVAERIKEARSFGDLSENAEYDAAKLEQAELEARINKLEAMMRNAKIIDEAAMANGIVNIGNTVTLKEAESKREVKYHIVGATEADPFKGKISNESAVGKALIGKSKGETVEVELIDGKAYYEILDVEN